MQGDCRAGRQASRRGNHLADEGDHRDGDGPEAEENTNRVACAHTSELAGTTSWPNASSDERKHRELTHAAMP
jgi:hypothetical protein